MAKLKAPLLSLGASQKLGDTLVFFNWKGLDVVRSYVVPANPKTTLQNTQRGYVTLAVEQIHIAMGWAAHSITVVDKTAWSKLATVLGMTMTWFNSLVKQIVDQKVNSKNFYFPTDGTTTPGAGQLAVSIWDIFGDFTAGRFYYGTSPSALVSYVAGVLAAGNFTATIPGLTAGVKYYWQFRPTAPAGDVGCNSGIYYGTPT